MPLMAYFSCTVHGQHFTQTAKERNSEVNFYTARWVEADSPEEAASHAVELVSVQLTEKRILRGSEQKATLEVEDLREVSDADFRPEFDAFIFY